MCCTYTLWMWIVPYVQNLWILSQQPLSLWFPWQHDAVHTFTHTYKKCVVLLTYYCLCFLSLVDGRQGSPGRSAGTCSHVFCNHPPLWCNTATHLHLHLTAHPLSPAEEQDTRYVRACIHMCGAVCYTGWMAQALQCVGVRMYMHTCIHMCDDIHILLHWVNGFMYIMNHNILWYTRAYALRVCILLYTNVYANDIRTYLLHWVHMFYCILNHVMYVRMYVRT